MATKKHPVEGTMSLWSLFRRVRNIAAERGYTDFDQDFNAYAACVEGRKGDLLEIIMERGRKSGVRVRDVRKRRMSEKRFKALQANYMRLLDAR